MTDNTNVSRRRFLQASGGAATAVALAGCTDSGGQETESPTPTDTPDDMTTDTEETEQPSQGGTLQLINSTMTTLDPVASTDTASGTVIMQVYDALLNYPNGEIAVENLLADDYEVSEDFRTYTFHLKEGVTYHDGRELTASDVVYSFERLAGAENTHRSYFILDYALGTVHETETVTDDEGEESEVYKPGSLGVEAVDDYTFEITLKESFHAALTVLAYSSFSVVPEGIVGDIDDYDGEMDYEEFATSNPVGTGPFEFDHWDPDTEAEVTRFDDFHGDAASLDDIHWQIIEDADASYNYSQNKNSDLISMPTAKYDPSKVSVEGTDDLGRQYGTYGPMRNGDTANYLAVATINTFYIGFNTDNVEKPARQAVAYAMNQQTMVDQVFKGRGATAYHFTPPNIYPGGAPEYRSHAENDYPYGYNESMLDEARQVMEDAGYDEDNQYEFTFTTYESPSWQQMGGILRDQLASCHIDMSLEEAPFSTLIERGHNSNLDAYSLGWIMDWPTPDNFLGLLYPPLTDTSNPAAQSYTNWSDTDAAQQATDAWETVESNPQPTDEAQSAREDAFIQIEEANWEDVVFLNVYHRVDERFWYDWVDIPRFGSAGGSRQKHNHTSITGSRE
jgi:peptide/nickel transport system substrate-binding protein